MSEDKQGKTTLKCNDCQTNIIIVIHLARTTILLVIVVVFVVFCLNFLIFGYMYMIMIEFLFWLLKSCFDPNIFLLPVFSGLVTCYSMDSDPVSCESKGEKLASSKDGAPSELLKTLKI